MCRIVSGTYTQCRHHKRSSWVYPCEAGYDIPHNRCRARRLTQQTVRVTAPLLCPDCYRAREDEICQSFDEARKDLKEKVAESAEILERVEAAYAAMLVDGRDGEDMNLEVEKRKCEVNDIACFLDGYREWLKDVEQQRKEKLSQFRAAQGVWGDG
jgi:hypothetical protein